MLAYEKMVLESICFDFRIIHPYKYVIKFTKMLNGTTGGFGFAAVCSDRWGKTLTNVFMCPLKIASKSIARQAWNIARDR